MHSAHYTVLWCNTVHTVTYCGSLHPTTPRLFNNLQQQQWQQQQCNNRVHWHTTNTQGGGGTTRSRGNRSGHKPSGSGGGHNKKQGQPQWALQRGGFLYYRGSVASSPALTIIFRIYSIVRQVTYCFVVAIIYEIKGTLALRCIERFNQWRAAGEMADRTVFLACGQWLI